MVKVVCKAITPNKLKDGYGRTHTVDGEVKTDYWYVYDIDTKEYFRIQSWIQVLSDGEDWENKKLTIRSDISGLHYDVVYSGITKAERHQYYWVPVCLEAHWKIELRKKFPDGIYASRGSAFEELPYAKRYGRKLLDEMYREPFDWVEPVGSEYYSVGVRCGNEIVYVDYNGKLASTYDSGFSATSLYLVTSSWSRREVAPIRKTKECAVVRTDYGHTGETYKLYNLPADTCVVELPYDLPEGAAVIGYTPLDGTIATKFGKNQEIPEKAEDEPEDYVQKFVTGLRAELDSQDIAGMFDRYQAVVEKLPPTLVAEDCPLQTLINICETLIGQLED